jgi:hypothetical protein
MVRLLVSVLVATCSSQYQAHLDKQQHATADDGRIRQPVEAPSRVRLFNPRAGDPRRRVGDILSLADLQLKRQVDQKVYGKHAGTSFHATSKFDPFREGEIVAFRRGEMVGVMSEAPVMCLAHRDLKNAPTCRANNDKDCVLLRPCDQQSPYRDVDCPADSHCSALDEFLTYHKLVQGTQQFELVLNRSLPDIQAAHASYGRAQLPGMVCVGKQARKCYNNQCVPTHCAQVGGPTDGMRTRFGERTEGPEKVFGPEGYDQALGSLETPGAGVDYNRDEIVREIRYGEFVKYENGLFYVITKKTPTLTPKGTTIWDEEQREGEPYPEPPELRAIPTASIEKTDQLSANRVFQIWAAPNQASLQPDEDGKLRYFDAHHEHVVKINSGNVSALLALEHLHVRLHVMLEPGDYILDRPLNFVSTRVHITGVQNFTETITPVSGTASSTYASTTGVENLINAGGLAFQMRAAAAAAAAAEAAGDGGGGAANITNVVAVTGAAAAAASVGPSTTTADTTAANATVDPFVRAPLPIVYGSGSGAALDADAFDPLTSSEAGLDKRRRPELGAGGGLVSRGDGHDYTSVHDNQMSAQTMWKSAWGVVQHTWLHFDLGRHFNLTSMLVWNFNQEKVSTTRGVRSLRIMTSTFGGEGGSAGSAVPLSSFGEIVPGCEHWDKVLCPDPCNSPCADPLAKRGFFVPAGTGSPDLAAYELRLTDQAKREGVTTSSRMPPDGSTVTWGGGTTRLVRRSRDSV